MSGEEEEEHGLHEMKKTPLYVLAQLKPLWSLRRRVSQAAQPAE